MKNMSKSTVKAEPERGSLSFGAFLLAFGILVPEAVLAASFDCAKATTNVEKIICSDVKLSKMDEALNNAYHVSLKDSGNAGDVRREQKQWIADTRNACRDAKCLSEAYSIRISQLQEKSSGSGAQCPVNASQIAGSWQRIKGGDFEEFALDTGEGKRNFTSWLHHHPEFVGTWKLQECSLSIKSEQNDALDFEYKILKYQDKVLYLKSSDDDSQSSYRKVH